jgi:hypothetical protein
MHDGAASRFMKSHMLHVPAEERPTADGSNCGGNLLAQVQCSTKTLASSIASIISVAGLSCLILLRTLLHCQAMPYGCLSPKLCCQQLLLAMLTTHSKCVLKTAVSSITSMCMCRGSQD